MAIDFSCEAACVSVRLSDLFGVEPNPSAHVTDLEIQAAERELGVKLPPSYREFLRLFGAKVWMRSGLLGLPRDGLRRDLVLQNKIDSCQWLPAFVKFMEKDGGPCYYFAIKMARPDGECPVVYGDAEKGICIVADSFIQFLDLLGYERVSCSRMMQATR